MKIGIFTFHRAYNCGAMLQAWALKRVLEKMGHEVVFPLVTRVGDERCWYVNLIPESRTGFSRVRSIVGRIMLDFRYMGRHFKNASIFEPFRREYLRELSVPLSELPNYIDLAVVGSDQVWNPSLVYNVSVMLGETVPRSLPMVSYAASIGDGVPSLEYRERMARALRRFKMISVREHWAKNTLEDIVGRSVTQALDPTLLLSAEDYREVADYGKVPSHEYLYAYLLYGTDYEIQTAKQLAKALNVDLVYSTGSTGGMKNDRCVSPVQFCGLMEKAKYVLSCSFHGTAFAILNRKPFVSLRRTIDSNPSRPLELLESLGLSNRLVNPLNSMDDILVKIKQPFPDASEVRLGCLRDASLWYLSEATNSSRS